MTTSTKGATVLAISLRSVLDELAVEAGTKNLSGNVTDAAALFDPDNLERLAAIAPVLGFLAFHPRSDRPVVDYVRLGLTAADSGPNLLVLFALDAFASGPVPVGADAFAGWLQLDTGSHPAYDIVRLLFDAGAVPVLPGLVLLRTVGVNTDAVYVELSGLATIETVQARLREVFALADEVGRDVDVDHFGDQLGVRLRTRRIPYRRTRRLSTREWLVNSFQIVGDHLGDIVSVAGLLL
jgi:hypothetical protein